MRATDRKEPRGKNERVAARRNPYHRPTLRFIGAIEQITRGGQEGVGDFPNPEGSAV